MSLAGSVLVVGYGADPARVLERLKAGRRAGVILFRRNLPDLDAAIAQTRAFAAARDGAPSIVAVDEEGGRVRRMPAPFPALGPMRALGALGDVELTRRVGSLLGRLLHAAGFTLDFAPVADVDSNPANPIIGDRSFSSDPAAAARHAVALACGLDDEGVGACGKHFPGHGDTDVDSHLALPVLRHDRERLDAVELVPFRALARSSCPGFMTAHVVCEALSPAPATLAPAVATQLLRDELGYRGCLFSDDLEMRAVAERHPVEESAVLALAAGCDALLICSDEEAADRAEEAITREAEKSPAFATRLADASARVGALRAGLRRPEPSREGFERALASDDVQRTLRELRERLGA